MLSVLEDLQVSLVVRFCSCLDLFVIFHLLVATIFRFYDAINVCMALYERIRIHRYRPLLLLAPWSCIPNAVEPDKEKNLTGHFGTVDPSLMYRQ